ncbi:hypothetical protein WMF04_47650 [Sorangium sp. So ce260]|jgi:hypothetical protein|uniref:hypothetical protein n=1 Tax=Sorangium sp. So ce260 TaxID=3133291 RepID=UPI003F633AE4
MDRSALIGSFITTNAHATGVEFVKMIGKHFAAMFLLCVAAAPTVVACGSADGSDEIDPGAEELVGEGADEVFSCSWSTVTADATKSTLHWKALSLGDTYSPGLCPRYVVEFTQKDLLGVSWDHAIGSEAECEQLHLIYTGYTYSGGTWINKGSFHGHGEWSSGAPFGGCYLVADTGYSHVNLGSGTKYRIAAAAYDQNCTDTCYYDFKRVVVESYPTIP